MASHVIAEIHTISTQQAMSAHISPHYPIHKCNHTYILTHAHWKQSARFVLLAMCVLNGIITFYHTRFGTTQIMPKNDAANLVYRTHVSRHTDCVSCVDVPLCHWRRIFHGGRRTLCKQTQTYLSKPNGWIWDRKLGAAGSPPASWKSSVWRVEKEAFPSSYITAFVPIEKLPDATYTIYR